MNVNTMSLCKLTTSVNTNTNSNSSNSSSSNSSSSSTSAPRFALSINNNVANINNALLRNVQLSPGQLKTALNSSNQNTQKLSSLGLVNQQNLNSTLSNMQNYSVNLQLNNYQHQQNKTQSSNQQQTTNSLLALAANNLANQLQYQQQQPVQTTCNLNNTLFVGNLHASLQEIDLIQVFRPFGRIVECCKKWLHFGFVKFTTEEEACHAYVTLNGFRLKGRPMRLEFQNRTKKARIKAILAQAALQASSGSSPGTNSSCNNDILSMGNLNIAGVQNTNQYGIVPNYLEHDRQQLNLNSQNVYYSTNQTYQQTKKMLFINDPSTSNNFNAKNENSFFNSDQLIKFASTNSSSENLDSIKEKQFEMNFDLTESNNYYDLNNIDLIQYDDMIKNGKQQGPSTTDDLMSLLKKNISPSDSPTHEALSLSSDSGCRSNSFLNDEDSAITSIQSSIKFTKKTYENGKKKLEDCTISEHLEFTCSKSSPIKEEQLNSKIEEVEDEIDEDNVDDDDDCSSDCDTEDDASDIPSEADGDSDCLNDLDMLDENFLNNDSFCQVEETKRYNQVLEKDGTIIRKKLENGIYKSINQTLSLYIEPHDILKPIDSGEYDEYNLFPNGIEQALDSILVIRNHTYLF